jgi:hypothetical protein
VQLHGRGTSGSYPAYRTAARLSHLLLQQLHLGQRQLQLLCEFSGVLVLVHVRAIVRVWGRVAARQQLIAALYTRLSRRKQSAQGESMGENCGAQPQLGHACSCRCPITSVFWHVVPPCAKTWPP